MRGNENKSNFLKTVQIVCAKCPCLYVPVFFRQGEPKGKFRFCGPAELTEIEEQKTSE
jgi:hypothetical protein